LFASTEKLTLFKLNLGQSDSDPVSASGFFYQLSLCPFLVQQHNSSRHKENGICTI